MKTREKRFGIGPLRLTIALQDHSLQPHFRADTWRSPIQPAQAPSPSVELSPEPGSLEDRISKIAWYHTIDLGKGLVTRGLVDNRGHVDQTLPDDLTGKRCLDIGTFDGFWAFAMEARGASEVVALDIGSLEEMDIRPQSRQGFIEEIIRTRGTTKLGEGFALAKQVLGSKVERRKLNVYQLAPSEVGTFDLVHCGDLLPHLRDPQLAIQNIFSVTRGQALLGSAFDPSIEQGDEPVLKVCPTGGDFVWWWFSRAALRVMMQLAGFTKVEELLRVRVDNRAASFWKVYLGGEGSG